MIVELFPTKQRVVVGYVLYIELNKCRKMCRGHAFVFFVEFI